MMNHWAADLIGQPYTTEKDCWWLVGEVLRRRLELPVEPISIPSGAAAVKATMDALRLRPCPGTVPRHELDVVFCRDLKGRRHVGIMVRFGPFLQFLHSTEGTGVLREPFSTASLQMTAIEVWRRVPANEELPELALAETPHNRETIRIALQVAAIAAALAGQPQFAAALAAVNFAYNLLLPPKTPKAPNAADAVYSSSLSGNVPRLNDPIPKVCGRVKFTPPFAAIPYQRFEASDPTDPDHNRDQYFYSIFALSIDEVAVEKVLFGNTSAVHFADVTLTDLPPGTQPTEAQANIVTAVEVSSSELKEARYVGGISACRAGDTCVAISVDVGADQGLGKTDAGGSSSRTAEWQVEVREIDDYGRPLGEWVIIANESRTDNTNTPQRWTTDYTLSTPIRPEVRLVRTDTPGGTADRRDGIQWIGLRGELSRAAPLNAQTHHYEIVGRGSDQLSQQAQRQVFVIARGLIRTYDEDTGWNATREESRNPFWWALDFLREAKHDETGRRWGLNEPDSRIDLASFVAFAETADLRQDRFDMLFNERAEGWDTLVTICRAGRAFPFRRNGVISVARDERIIAAVRAFTTRNTEPGSIVIHEQKPRREQPDGVVLQFLSNVTSAVESIECPCPGYAPSGDFGSLTPLLEYDTDLPAMTNPIVVFKDGITGRYHAEREGIYEAHDLAYRKTVGECVVEMEGATVAYLDPCLLQPEYPGYGQTGDVAFWDAGTLVMGLSEPPDWSASPLYLTLRRDDGTLTDAVEVFAGPTANDVVLPAAPDFTLVIDRGDRERPQFLLGHQTTGTETVKVRNIVPQREDDGSLLFKLEFVVDDERVHLADNALLPGPGDLQDPVDDGSDYDDSGGGVALLVRLTSRSIIGGQGGDYGGLAGIDFNDDGTLDTREKGTAGALDTDTIPGEWLNRVATPAECALFSIKAEDYSGLGAAVDAATGASLTGSALETWIPAGTAIGWTLTVDPSTYDGPYTINPSETTVSVPLRVSVRRDSSGVVQETRIILLTVIIGSGGGGA
jgi:hypothetical protein